jgi:ATP-dependent DNA helicase RecQ
MIEETILLQKARAVLSAYFGFNAFRPGQEEIVSAILKQKDVLAILPTGAGKSLCFQVPGLCMTGTTFIISPLISLMEDQVAKLEARGIAATFLSSSVSTEELARRIESMKSGKYVFVYVSPERLQSKDFREAIKQMEVPFVAIDEAHCISQWGHDFRPSYREIASFLQSLPKRPIVAAFTATATTLVQKDILTQLSLKEAQIFRRSFRRPNLSFFVRQFSYTHQKELTLFRILKRHEGNAGIIYCQTRDRTEQTTQLLNMFGFAAKSYHAGMSAAARSAAQQEFLNDKTPIIVATNAFGMGVDKPDIRFVIHAGLPNSLEGYSQEVGRAGRDGQQSWCYLLFTDHDLKLQMKAIKRQIEKKKWSAQYEEEVIRRFASMTTFACKQHCRVRTMLKYFGEELETKRCDQCNICLHWQITPSVTEKARQMQLLFARQILSKKYQLKIEYFPNSLIAQIALHQPQSEGDFLKLPGIGTGWMTEWFEPLTKLQTPNVIPFKGLGPG